MWFYIRKRFGLAIVNYILALLSNEIALALPLIFFSWKVLENFRSLSSSFLLLGFLELWQSRRRILQRNLIIFFAKALQKLLEWGRKDKLWFFFSSLPLVLMVRMMIGWHKADDYTLSLNFLPVLRWYFFRALNLPEGMDRAEVILYFLFLMFILVLVLGLWENFEPRVVALGIMFFVFGALPFYFLPYHMSSYYLTMAMFGPALIYTQAFRDEKMLLVAGVIYLALTIYGLDFLSRTHWIILKNTGPIGKF